MKRIAKRLMIVVMVSILIVCATSGVSASEATGNIYQIENVTIIFDADSNLTREQQESIAQFLVNPEYGVSQANLICNLFGHKNTQEGVSTITHKVSTTDPRCLQELFTITTCSRCNEATVERDAAIYISCCPED